MSIEDIPSIRVVCCGDRAVGKSQIASRLAGTQLILDDNDLTVALDLLVGDISPTVDDEMSYDPTVGCRVHTLAFTTALGSPYFVEIFDVGGSSDSLGIEQSRSLFFDACDAVIFVWDVSDESTYHSLHRWLAEISARNDSRLISKTSELPPNVQSSPSGPRRSAYRERTESRQRPLLLVSS